MDWNQYDHELGRLVAALENAQEMAEALAAVMSTGFSAEGLGADIARAAASSRLKRADYAVAQAYLALVEKMHA